jgi:hypothetical protein
MHLVAKQEKLREKLTLILPKNYLLHTPHGSLTCRKILRHETDGFTSPPKEVVIRIFIALKGLSSSGFKPENLGSIGKHYNHYTTEGDESSINIERTKNSVIFSSDQPRWCGNTLLRLGTTFIVVGTAVSSVGIDSRLC